MCSSMSFSDPRDIESVGLWYGRNPVCGGTLQPVTPVPENTVMQWTFPAYRPQDWPSTLMIYVRLVQGKGTWAFDVAATRTDTYEGVWQP